MCSDEGERYIGLLCVSLRPGQGLTYVLRSGRWAPWQDRFRGFSGRGEAPWWSVWGEASRSSR